MRFRILEPDGGDPLSPGLTARFEPNAVALLQQPHQSPQHRQVRRSAATDDERRAALEPVLKWWSQAGSPVYDRLRTA